MMQVRSILVALERAGNAAQILAKAAMLARRFDARLDIFLCEAEGAFALEHQYDAAGSDEVRRSCLARMHAWMDRQWRSLEVSDVAVTIEAAYESPLYDAIGRKARRSGADLGCAAWVTIAEVRFALPTSTWCALAPFRCC